MQVGGDMQVSNSSSSNNSSRRRIKRSIMQCETKRKKIPLSKMYARRLFFLYMIHSALHVLPSLHIYQTSWLNLQMYLSIFY